MAAAKDEAPDFRMADSHGYILSRGHHLATARLNLQHFLWQRILKFTIHPQILKQLPAEPVIADIAAGTALWSLDVAHEIPKAQLQAYDVDLTQAPAPGWLPSNVQVSEWDIFKDPPADMIGRFDVVHIRLLVLVLSGLDPNPVFQRFRSLLKPGGWLQWEDLDTTRMHVKRASPDVVSPSLDAIIDMSHSGGRHDWLVKLPEMLSKQGFVEASIEEFDDPVELCRAFNDQHLMTMEEFAEGLAKAGKQGPSEKVLEVVRNGYHESTKGAAICYPRVCCIAKKVS